MKPLAAIDWGTSSLRGALLDASGRVVEERAFARGILSVAAGEFANVFAQCFGDWMQGPDSLALICGMAGSRQGWTEAPYCPCPAGFAEVAARLVWLPAGPLPPGSAGRVALVPGLSCERACAGGRAVPDVMRGEETQVFGALQMLGLRDGDFVLPGTHSKWVKVRDGRVLRFSTSMTGEFYALLRQHSILSRTLPAEDGTLDEAAFDEGVATARTGPGLLDTAFSVRTLSLFDRMPATALPSYLSGLVIGEELRSQLSQPGSAPACECILIGAPALVQRYERALALFGLRSRRADAQAAWHGLWAVAQSL